MVSQGAFPSIEVWPGNYKMLDLAPDKNYGSWSLILGLSQRFCTANGPLEVY